MLNDQTILLPPNPAGNGADANYRLTVMVPKRRYLSYLRERWWVVMVIVALTVSGVVTYETVRKESFVSTAQLYAAGEVQLSMGSILSEDQANYFGTQVELFKTPRIQADAFSRAGIVLEPGQANPYKVDVVRPMSTAILQLRATGPDAESVQRYLEAVINAYLDYKKETRRTTSEDLMESLTREVAKRDAELKAGLEKLAQFQKSNNVAVLEEEGKSAGLYLADLNLQLAKLRLERELVETGSRPADAPLSTNSLPAPGQESAPAATATAGTNQLPPSLDAALKSAKVELAVLRAEWSAKTNELDEMHPAMRGLTDNIMRWSKTVAALEDLDLTQRQTELQALEKRISAIQAAIPDEEVKVLGLNDRLSQGQRLKSDIQRQQGYYDHLLQTIQTVDLSKNIQSERLSILQSATDGQVERRMLGFRVVLATVAGLALSLGVVFIWYLLDDRFVSVQDIKDQFGELVLGLVPQIKIARSKPRDALLLENYPRRPYAESYRHLRSALMLSSLSGGRPQTLLLTSASPAEGKTTLAVNLGRALARGGMRVALVDIDFHSRGLERVLGTDPKPGLLDFLRGQAAASDFLYPTEVPGLAYVPAGFHPEQAEGLFLESKLEGFIAELKKDRDFVLFDAPPILSADDAALLVPHCDAVVVVMRPFYTRSKLVRRALEMLYQRQAKQVTLIFNRARREDLAGHYARNGMSRPAKTAAPAQTPRDL